MAATCAVFYSSSSCSPCVFPFHSFPSQFVWFFLRLVCCCWQSRKGISLEAAVSKLGICQRRPSYTFPSEIFNLNESFCSSSFRWIVCVLWHSTPHHQRCHQTLKYRYQWTGSRDTSEAGRNVFVCSFFLTLFPFHSLSLLSSDMLLLIFAKIRKGKFIGILEKWIKVSQLERKNCIRWWNCALPMLSIKPSANRACKCKHCQREAHNLLCGYCESNGMDSWWHSIRQVEIKCGRTAVALFYMMAEHLARWT